MSKFFNELMESVQQMDEIVQGERQPSPPTSNNIPPHDPAQINPTPHQLSSTYHHDREST